MMQNPLLTTTELPLFDQIKPEHIEPALDQTLADNRAQLDTILQDNALPTWENLLYPLEEMHDRLSHVWSPVSHLKAVENSDALREAYTKCLPKLTAYSNELMQNEALYKRMSQLKNSDQFTKLSIGKQKVVTNMLRDFRLNGVSLDPQKKAEFSKLDQELSELSNRFSENVLDATKAYSRHITDINLLRGIPEHGLSLLKQAAAQKKLEGWLITLDQPSYLSVITYADNRELREEIYTAYVTRASDLAANKAFDNSTVMESILKIRHQLAQLLGFANYADLSLATKMAESPQAVLDFLHNLVERSKKKGLQEFSELKDFAKSLDSIDDLNAWDIAYYSEKLQEKQYSISQEELRPYFPEERVLDGLFTVTQRLFGMRFTERKNVPVWHKDVRFFEVYDENNHLRGQLYMDLYAREDKRGGAWMDDCRGRRRLADNSMQTPIAFLTCNFSGPTENTPALFTHEEVITLFHECGHTLHHLLTQVEEADIAGINGVEWDAVELPSQLYEEWCWKKEALDLMSSHYQTHEPLPQDLLEKMLAAKNFQTALIMLRQLEFSLFDFYLHKDYDPAKNARVQEMLDKIRQEVAVIVPPSFNRFQHGFSHIFSGGYAAGYYSYKWAEVLSCDAFSLFEEEGIFNPKTGRAYLHHILEQGGTKNMAELFQAFRGRPPKIDALLRLNGIN